MLMPDYDFSLLRLVKLLVVAAVVLFAVFFVYGWYTSSGRIKFEGTLANSDYLLVAGQTGRAASVEARPGDIVINGQPLLRFDNSAQRKHLERERQKLIQFARMLPPEHIRLPDPDDPTVGNETLTRRLARKGAAEREAIKALQEASDIEARAGVEFSRASIMYSQGQITREQLNRAETALNEARGQIRLARERQEKYSTQRATAETAIRRVLEYHAASGATRVPLQDRIDQYEAQRMLVEQLARSVSVAYLAAPFEGTIQEVLVQPDENLTESTPCFVLQPATMPLTLNCTVGAELAARLAQGQQCLVLFPDYGEEELPGYVAGIGPGEDPAWRVISVDVIQEGSEPLVIPPGARGAVAVLLRKPLLSPEQIRTVSGGVRGASGGTMQPAAPSTQPDRQTGTSDGGAKPLEEREEREGPRAVSPPAPEPDKDPGRPETAPAAPGVEPPDHLAAPVRVKAGQSENTADAAVPPQPEQPPAEPRKRAGRRFVSPSARPASSLQSPQSPQRPGALPVRTAPRVLGPPGTQP